MSISLRGWGRGGGSGWARRDWRLLPTRTGDWRHTVWNFDPSQTDRRHNSSGWCCCSHGRHSACSDRFGLSLKSRAADEVMSLPVFVLAEGATVASSVAAAARLASFAATIPATLRREERYNQSCSNSILFHYSILNKPHTKQNDSVFIFYHLGAAETSKHDNEFKLTCQQAAAFLYMCSRSAAKAFTLRNFFLPIWQVSYRLLNKSYEACKVLHHIQLRHVDLSL